MVLLNYQRLVSAWFCLPLKYVSDFICLFNIGRAFGTG